MQLRYLRRIDSEHAKREPLKLLGWTLGLLAVSYTLFGEKGVLLATALATYVCYVVEAKQ